VVPLAFEGKPRNHEHRTHANAAPETTTHGFTSHLRSSQAARCPASADPRILVLTQLGIVSLGQCSGTPDAVPERQGRAAFHCDGLGVLSVFAPMTWLSRRLTLSVSYPCEFEQVARSLPSACGLSPDSPTEVLPCEFS